MRIPNLLVSLSVIVSLNTSCKNEKTNSESHMDDSKILFVTSNQHTYGNTTQNTANHFDEIVSAYHEFIIAGYKVDFVSPEGGAIPLGYIKTSDTLQKHYLYKNDFMNLLKNTLKPVDIKSKDYRAVYYPGGGAAMYGVPFNKKIQRISREIYENNGVVSTVCHGTAGIVNIKLSNGKYLYEGKKITGYPKSFENMNSTHFKTFPFIIDDAILENGGDFQFSKQGWDNFFIVDDRIVSGQDPTASKSVAIETIKLLNKIK